MSKPAIQLGLRENWAQFSLLVLVNAFVGAMVGMERSILPAIAEDEFELAARTAILSFIVVFGVTKALTNYFAGRWSDRFGRKHVLVAGWLLAAPVPFLLMWAPSWSWILAANVLLGVSQGLTWSTTVIMKIDLAGPKNRGLAMGLNEFAGYFAVALSALATGFIAAEVGLRPQPFYLGVGFVLLGTLLSVFAVKETLHHVAHESKLAGAAEHDTLSQREVIARTSLTDPDLSSVSQAGMVNNLNDGMAWGLFPLVFAAAGMSLQQIGWLAAIYPAVWGMGQLVTGAWSDRIGRKGLIVAGMWTQAAGILAVALGSGFWVFVLGAVLLGLGTAMVYPTLLAAIGDVAHPSWRASSVGVYRLWRDMGYAVGALLAGIVADAFGLSAATLTIAALTFASGVVVAVRMRETLRREAPSEPAVPGTNCIEPEALAQLPGAVVIDVRSPAEYAEAHVDGALNIPLDLLADRAAELSTDAPLVTACGKGGGRSEQGAALLRELGFASVRSLCGGTSAWLARRPLPSRGA
ncbi:MAG: MFS transporter [Alphaproteobacteria bacterium]|nr:MFS transporter [Alphaproteobacteria bacterium]MCB9793668.1 MFS transporter [Alphaproteobacteria bacterium]